MRRARQCACAYLGAALEVEEARHLADVVHLELETCLLDQLLKAAEAHAARQLNRLRYSVVDDAAGCPPLGHLGVVCKDLNDVITLLPEKRDDRFGVGGWQPFKVDLLQRFVDALGCLERSRTVIVRHRFALILAALGSVLARLGCVRSWRWLLGRRLPGRLRSHL